MSAPESSGLREHANVSARILAPVMLHHDWARQRSSAIPDLCWQHLLARLRRSFVCDGPHIRASYTKLSLITMVPHPPFPLSHMVGNCDLGATQARKAPVQRLADTIAGKFTWLVFAASASTLLFWGALSPSVLGAASASAPAALAGVLGGGQGGGAWALGVRLAVDVCLVACPCSLGLATPTAIMVRAGEGERAGNGVPVVCVPQFSEQQPMAL